MVSYDMVCYVILLDILVMSFDAMRLLALCYVT